MSTGRPHGHLLPKRLQSEAKVLAGHRRLRPYTVSNNLKGSAQMSASTRMKFLGTASLLACVTALTITSAHAAPAREPLIASQDGSEPVAPLPADDPVVMYESFVDKLAEMTGDEGGTVPTLDGQKNRYAGFSIDESRLGVDLYWVGDIAPSVLDLIEEHPEAKVTIHAAEYPLVDMIAARDAISNRYDSMPGENGEFFMVAPNVDGSGLRLHIRASESEVSREQVEGVVAQITDMKLTSVIIGEEERVIPLSGGRTSDVSTHYSGAIVKITDSSNGQGQWCTTGAPVEGKSTGNKYMLTAVHCMEVPGQPDNEIDSEGNVYNGAGTFIGTWRWAASQLEKNRHAILIKLKNGSTNTGLQYWGNYASFTNYPIAGTATSPLGATNICTSGANTGTQCNGKVTDKNMNMSHGGVGLLNTVEVTHPTLAMAGSGDSGGPVSRLYSNGDRSLAGFVYSSGYLEPPVSCGRVTFTTSPLCFKRIVYMGGVDSALDSLNVKLRP